MANQNGPSECLTAAWVCTVRRTTRDRPGNQGPSLWKWWWRMSGSNRRPPACKAGALPAELIPHDGLYRVVGLVGFEPTTPALSRRCSNQLSYRPTVFVHAATSNLAKRGPSALATRTSTVVFELQPISVSART
jgi:hypothetical protein